MWGGVGNGGGGLRTESPVFLFSRSSPGSPPGLLLLGRNPPWICKGHGALCPLKSLGGPWGSHLFRNCCLLGISFSLKEVRSSLRPVTLDFCRVSLAAFSPDKHEAVSPRARRGLLVAAGRFGKQNFSGPGRPLRSLSQTPAWCPQPTSR